MIFLFNKKRGFTLVEMMVAIAVFSLVMVTAMSALLNVIDANSKARALKTSINNISFALEGISKDMRMGTDYVCGTDFGSIPETVDDGCSSGNGGKIIGYISPRGYKDPDTEASTGHAYYRLNNYQIEACLEKNLNDICVISEGDFKPITSSEVTLNNVAFYILGVESLDDFKTQPRMIMTVNGSVESKEKLRTEFDLQTSVSQRIRPELQE